MLPISLPLLVLVLVFALPMTAQTGAPQRASATAKRLLDQGKYAEAIPLLLELKKAAPSDNGLQMNLGTAYAATGDLSLAAREFAAIRQRDPSFSPAALSLAGVLMNLDRAREAIELLAEQVERNPRNGEARNMLASIYRATGDLARANEQLRELATLAPNDARSQHLLHQSYREIARQSFALVEQAAPESAYMVAIAGYDRLAREEYSSAFYLMREALKRDAKLHGPNAAIANIYTKTAHPDWALAEAQRNKQLEPPDCSQTPAACAYLRGDLDAAMQSTRFARLPEDLYWRYRAASDLAERAYSRLQALPKSIHALGAKADRLRELGRHPEAVAVWKEAIRLAPANPGLEKELVVSLYQARDYPACALAADKLLKSNPGDPEVQLLRGDAALSQQDAAGALPFIEKAVSINPDMLPAQASLGRALLQLGRAAQAVPHLEKALAFDRDGSILYMLAQAYQKSGNEERGKQALVRYQEFQKRDRAEKAEFEEKFRITAP